MIKTVRHVEEQGKKETMEMLEQKTKEHQRTLDDFNERSAETLLLTFLCT